ncbi:peroxiredoxin, Ohr subfamily [Propionibacterium cyclohexanicum]|uniref:Peroxiredoxin, Ohr subfamily n=1 Tax=Propionibacterium cyclohexanicum TaxID=64702 RepID=A0A1H9TFI0_9ACTN|nr:organic hydroperoxide resistance protein [Propionibacterium cyclohexanicum]SER95868.1 peroxiredoxin, Ohr subfamily [Propionibacterium cyclohexanicum]
MEALYTAEALSTGGGRDGHVRTVDGRLDTDMAAPKEMGGSGAGLNPELLFAAGYAACFNSALHAVARKEGTALRDVSVGSRVSIGANDAGGYQLQVVLEINVPGLDHEAAVRLINDADQLCPYSNALRGNVDITLDIVDE